MVSIHRLALLIDDENTVCVAVEGDADIRPQFPNLGGKGGGSRGSDIVVDVEAIGIDADGDHFRSEFPKGLRRNAVGRAIGAIDHDP